MRQMPRPNYVIYAPDFDPDSGGSIFLHQLAHALTALGEDAALWPWGWLPSAPFRERLRRTLRKPRLAWQRPEMKLRQDPTLRTRIAAPSDLGPATVAVYPEVTLGNPLGVKNVARWLLYRPGLKDPYSFGEGEIYFRAGEMSDLPQLTGGAQDLFLWRRNPIYRNEGRSGRRGVCYAVRKGHKKPRIPETEGAICIDGLSHEETAAIFNRCETFFSYDEATFYSQYAAICGCDSIVVPGYFANRAEWIASHPIARFGVAYGLNDIFHARATRDQVIGELEARERAGLETVKAFVARMQGSVLAKIDQLL